MSRLTEAENDYWARQASLRHPGPVPTVTLPTEQVERVLRVLTDREWSAADDGEAWCWTDCHEYQSDGHAPDCELAASIADLKALGL